MEGVNSGPTFERTFVVRNAAGIHARPAAKIVQLITKHLGPVTASTPAESGDGKSMMHLMLLAAGQGMGVRFEFGPPEDSARRILDELDELFAEGFGER